MQSRIAVRCHRRNRIVWLTRVNFAWTKSRNVGKSLTSDHYFKLCTCDLTLGVHIIEYLSKHLLPTLDPAVYKNGVCINMILHHFINFQVANAIGKEN